LLKKGKKVRWWQGGKDNKNRHERGGGRGKKRGRTKEVGGRKIRNLCFFSIV